MKREEKKTEIQYLAFILCDLLMVKYLNVIFCLKEPILNQLTLYDKYVNNVIG